MLRIALPLASSYRQATCGTVASYRSVSFRPTILSHSVCCVAEYDVQTVVVGGAPNPTSMTGL